MGSLSRRIRSRIAANKRRGIATSTIWKITYRACVTTFAPILMSLSRTPNLHRDSRTWLSTRLWQDNFVHFTGSEPWNSSFRVV